MAVIKMTWSGLRRIEPEAYAMDRFKVHLRVGFKVFPQFGNENVHAPAEEVIVFAPDIKQDFLSFEDAVGVFAEELQQIGFFLGEVEDLGTNGEL